MAPKDVTTKLPEVIQLSPAVREKVTWFMDRVLQVFTKKVGESVRLICGHSITDAVLKELPDSTLSWTLNEEPLVMDPSRVFYYKGNVDITDLTPGDTGVYACYVQWGAEKAKQNVTLGVFSVQVTTDSPTRYVFELEPMRVVCHSATLGRLFPSSFRQWLYNGTAVTSPPQTLAKNRTDDVVDSVKKSMAGVWECQVVHTRTDRIWHTAWSRISVEDAPSWAAKVYRQMANHTMVVAVVLSIVVLIMCILFVVSSLKVKKEQDGADKDFGEHRGGWEQVLSKQTETGKLDLSEIKEKEETKDSKVDGDKDDDDESDDDEDEGVDDVEGSKSEKEYSDEEESGEDSSTSSEESSSEGEEDRPGRDEKVSDINESASPEREVAAPEMSALTRLYQPDDGGRPRKHSHRVKFQLSDTCVQESNDPSTADRRRKHKKRKSKKLIVSGAVDKELAYKWLLKYSPKVGRLDAGLQESRTASLVEQMVGRSYLKMIYEAREAAAKNNFPFPARSLGDAGDVGGAPLSVRFCDGKLRHSAPRQTVAGDCEVRPVEMIPLVNLPHQHHTSRGCSSHTRGGNRAGDQCRNNNALKQFFTERSKQLKEHIQPGSLRSWISQQMNRFAKGQRSSASSRWLHSNVKYSVLPQADHVGSDFDGSDLEDAV